MFERSEEKALGEERSESPGEAHEHAEKKPLEALADKGFFSAPAHRPAPKTRDTEVVAKPVRRTYTAEYKLKIIRQAEALAGTGGIGAMLRREGLYDQQLSDWRRDLATGIKPNKRGPVPKPVDPNAAELTALRRENMLLRRQLARSELVIDIQKKVALLLGFSLPLDQDQQEP